MLAYLIRLYGFRRELYVEPVIFLNNTNTAVSQMLLLQSKHVLCELLFVCLFPLSREAGILVGGGLQKLIVLGFM